MPDREDIEQEVGQEAYDTGYQDGLKDGVNEKIRDLQEQIGYLNGDVINIKGKYGILILANDKLKAEHKRLKTDINKAVQDEREAIIDMIKDYSIDNIYTIAELITLIRARNK